MCFVGTSCQAKEVIERACPPSACTSSRRWLGGTLTNFRTIRSRLAASKNSAPSSRTTTSARTRRRWRANSVARWPRSAATRRPAPYAQTPRRDGRHRHQPRTQRPPRAQTRHPDDLSHRHRRRPGPGGHRHPRQRRLDARHRCDPPRTPRAISEGKAAANSPASASETRAPRASPAAAKATGVAAPAARSTAPMTPARRRGRTCRRRAPSPRGSGEEGNRQWAIGNGSKTPFAFRPVPAPTVPHCLLPIDDCLPENASDR